MKIKSTVKDCNLEFIRNSLGKKDQIFSKLKYSKLFYFVDENFYKIYKKDLDAFIGDNVLVVIPAEEQNKSYLKLAEYFRVLIEKKFTRADLLVTFGGGVLQDISGFIASTLYRGIKWVYFPTTLLAQADSCIGSKTSINFDDSKNLIGTFYPPDMIINDISFLRTLSREQFNSGLGEMIKFHLMSDEKGYSLLKGYLRSPDPRKNKYLKKIIHSTLKIKYSYFKQDEFDTGRRNLLNYGHCFGHALESATNFKVSHGEAVIVGMGFADLISLKRGIMSREKYDEFGFILRKYYPRFDINKINAEDIIYYMGRDKKRVGKDLTMILSVDIGKQFKYDDLKEDEVRKAYSEFVGQYPKDMEQL